MHSIEVGRLTIVKDMLQVYQQFTELCGKEIRVTFHNENGVNMCGLTRELFTVFWTAIESSYFAGNIEKVPVLAPRYLSDFFVLGKSLSHCFVYIDWLFSIEPITGLCIICYNGLSQCL